MYRRWSVAVRRLHLLHIWHFLTKISTLRIQTVWRLPHHFLRYQFLLCYSSLHNNILNAFCLVFVLWSLLLPSRAFSFLRHSCSKKFQWRWNIIYFGERKLYLMELQHIQTESHTFISNQPHPYNVNFLSPLERCIKEKALFVCNRLHNTKTT